MNGSPPSSAIQKISWSHVLGTAVGSLVLGLFAAWIAADLLPRLLTFLAVAGATGYRLFATAAVRRQAAIACKVLAGLLVVTPLFVVLPDVLSADTYGVSAMSMVVSIANLLLFVPFALAAAIVAYVAYRLEGGTGIVQRVRNRRASSSTQPA
jgi:hypothetical protein